MPNPESSSFVEQPTQDEKNKGNEPEANKEYRAHLVTVPKIAHIPGVVEEADKSLASEAKDVNRYENMSREELTARRKELEDCIYLIRILTGTHLIDEYGEDMENDKDINSDSPEEWNGLLSSIMHAANTRQSYTKIQHILRVDKKSEIQNKKHRNDLQDQAAHLLEGLSASRIAEESSIVKKAIDDMRRDVQFANYNGMGDGQWREFLEHQKQLVKISNVMQQRIREIDEVLQTKST